MLDLNVLFKVSYGMYIVSSGNGRNGNGFISNSVFQVTAEPVQFAACCNKDNYTANLIKESKAFSISILKQSASKEIIGTFGYKSGDQMNKLESVEYKTGDLGIPIVTSECIGFIECNLIDTFDVGTHLIFIGQAINSEELDNAPPLTYAYYREVKNGVAPKNAPTFINKKLLEQKAPESKRYKCLVCSYIYDPNEGDPESGIPAGTKFEDLPTDWSCPVCGAEKIDFTEI